MATIKIHQIYYNQDTFLKLDKGFIPLDNSMSTESDWFEFAPILNYLNQSKLEDEVWYGFLSPNFRNKTGVQSKFVIDILNDQDKYADVALLHTGWDQICYFKNPWEQGEIWHPGLKSFSQRFFDHVNLKVDVDEIVTDMTSSIFSNYIIAKKRFWLDWLKIANQFFNYMINMNSKDQKTPYGNYKNLFPIKTFVQERFASLVLTSDNFNVLAIDQSFGGTIYTRLFKDSFETRELLKKCDLLKNKYRQTKDKQFLNAYLETRASIKFTPPNL